MYRQLFYVEMRHRKSVFLQKYINIHITATCLYRFLKLLLSFTTNSDLFTIAFPDPSLPSMQVKNAVIR